MAYFDMSRSDLEDLFFKVPVIPRPRTYKSTGGFINASALDPQTFLGWFRFEQEHLKQLKDGLRIPQVMRSAQGVVVPGEEALLMTLRRLAHPNRWCDLEPLFGRATCTMPSVVSQVMGHVDRVIGHLLDNLTTHTWLTLDNLNVFSQAVHNHGATLINCWGFVDGTARPICRPSVEQSEYFPGHKRTHVVKYQAVMGAYGIVCERDDPYPAGDTTLVSGGILGESSLYSKLQRLIRRYLFCIYGDPAYPLRPLLMRLYGGASLTEQQQLFNEGMSTVRQAVEWTPGSLTPVVAAPSAETSRNAVRAESRTAVGSLRSARSTLPVVGAGNERTTLPAAAASSGAWQSEALLHPAILLAATGWMR
ncbi:hypothetical protein MRX96_046202 [Rhipicephalus microplus]